jgi:hypothetical protein
VFGVCFCGLSLSVGNEPHEYRQVVLVCGFSL